MPPRPRAPGRRGFAAVLAALALCTCSSGQEVDEALCQASSVMVQISRRLAAQPARGPKEEEAAGGHLAELGLALCGATGGLLALVLAHELGALARLSGGKACDDALRIRPFQSTVVVMTALSMIEYTAVIPMALSLASSVGWSPGRSGLLVGVHAASEMAGSMVARVIQPRISYRLSRKLAVASLAASASSSLLTSLLFVFAPPSSGLLWAHLGTRAAGGMLMGVAHLATNVVRKVTPGAEQSLLSMFESLGYGIGTAGGPLLCSATLAFVKATGSGGSAFFDVGALSLVMAMLLALAALLMSLAFPPAPPATWSEDEEEEEAEGSNRPAAVLAALVGMGLCTTSGSSLEAATSMLLEEQYGLRRPQVGLAMGLTLGPTVLLSGVYMALINAGLLSERGVGLILLVMAAVGAALLFEVRSRSFGPAQLLVSDFLLYPTASVLYYALQATAYRQAVRGHVFACTESITLFSNCAEGLAVVACPVTRGILDNIGRNAYASAQAAFVAALFAVRSLTREA